jgi:hypothetical protein
MIQRWEKALEGFDVKESPFLKALEDNALAKGKTEGKAEALLQMLGKRFKTVPDDLRTAILAQTDSERLTEWTDLAFTVRSLKGFREKAEV